jgi:hypothetical protein
MMLGFTTGTITTGGGAPPADMTWVRSIFTTSCIFHSYMIGIVAGKISEESIAAGFKHAAILVVISAVAAQLLPMFIKLG